MKKRVADDKLQAFFLDVVRQSFWQLGIYDSTVAGYIADVLVAFARADTL